MMKSTLAFCLLLACQLYVAVAGTSSNHLDLQPLLGYEPPLPGSDLTVERAANCPCKKILVSSLGEAQHVQAASMGVYSYYKDYNAHPVYYGASGKYLYFLNESGWLLGPSLGSPTGFIHNANAYLCPYLLPAGWLYVNNGVWFNDPTLVVRCTA